MFLLCPMPPPAKGKGQLGKVKINTELVHDILNLEEVKEGMAAILLSLKEEYSRNLSLRTSPGECQWGRLVGWLPQN